MKKHTSSKNTFKTNKISTFPPPRSVPRTTPDDQNHPRAPPGPLPGTLRKLDVFSEPPGPSPRSLRSLPGTPPGTPRDPPGTPRDPPGPPRRPPRDPRVNPTEPENPPSDLQGPPNDAQGPQETPNTAQGPPPRFGPAECAKRLNPPPLVVDKVASVPNWIWRPPNLQPQMKIVKPPYNPPSASAHSAGPSPNLTFLKILGLFWDQNRFTDSWEGSLGAAWLQP